MSTKEPDNVKEEIKSLAFFDKVIHHVEENLENEYFSVEDLASKLNMHRTQVYRKIKSITKKSVRQTIREIRLRKALGLLQHTELTVSEISFKVGFSSPSYFNKCFHHFYGFTPGEVRGIGVKNIEEFTSKTKTRFSELYRWITTFKQGKFWVAKTFWLILLAAFILLISLLYVIIPAGFKSRNDTHSRSIAVLVFENLSNDPNRQHFNEGIAENIRDKLSGIDGLNVISMTSSKLFSSKNENIKIIGRKLKADYILEGSILPEGNSIQIIAQLIESKKDVTIWSHKFEIENSDLFIIQNEIALSIASALKLNLTENEYYGLNKIREINPKVYSNYRLALNLQNKYLERNDAFFNDRAIHILVEIIKNEPQFPEAYVDLAWGLHYMRFYNYTLYKEIGSDSIIGLVYDAIHIDPDYFKSYYFLASYAKWNNDTEKEKTYLNKVLELNPNDYATLFRLARISLAEREVEQAIELYVKAIKIKPVINNPTYIELDQMCEIGSMLDELNLENESRLIYEKMVEMDSIGALKTKSLVNLAEFSFKRKDFDKALSYARAFYQYDSTDLFRINNMGATYMYLGQYKEALTYFKLSSSQGILNPDTDTTWYYPHMAYCLNKLGRFGEAEEILTQFLKLNKNTQFREPNWKVLNMAEGFALSGMTDEALELIKSLPYGNFSQFILNDILLGNLYKEPDFQKVIHEIQMEQKRISQLAISKKVHNQVTWLMNQWEVAI